MFGSRAKAKANVTTTASDMAALAPGQGKVPLDLGLDDKMKAAAEAAVAAEQAAKARFAERQTAAGGFDIGGGGAPAAKTMMYANSTNGDGNGAGSAGPSGTHTGNPGDTPNPKDPFSHAAPEGSAKKLSEVLGETVWLLSQSPLHKQFFISDLEWFIMTPVLLQQFRLFYATNKPIGLVLWARVNDDVATRLAEGTTKLRPQDWKSGDQLWVVEVIAPFGGPEEMIKDLKAKVFPNEDIRYVALSKDGTKEVKVV